MVTGSLLQRSLASLVLASCLGCEWVGGIEQRSVWVPPPDAGAGDAQPDQIAPPPGCTLPTEGDATVRIGNLVPSIGRFDFCFALADGSEGSDVAPVLRSSGADCPRGLGYRELTAPLRLPAGSYVVSAVEPTSASCDTPVASVTAEIDDTSVFDFYMLGDAVSSPILKVFRESRPSSAAQSSLRVIHAAPQEGSADVGYVASSTLPATLVDTLFEGVTYGGTATPGSSVDENGYIAIHVGGGVLPFGAAPVGTSDARSVCRLEIPNNDAATLYLVGKDGDPDFPLEMFGCREASSQHVLAECGSAEPVELKIALYQTYLNGVWAMEEPRRQFLRQVVPEIDADVLFVSDVWSDVDKQAFIDGAKESFPHSMFAATDLSSPINDPRDVDGNVPTPYEAAPCAPVLGEIEAALDCVRDHCTNGGAESSTMVTTDTTDCMTSHCFAELLALGLEEGAACRSCMATFLQSYQSIGETRDQCETNPEARFAYLGKTGTLILSKYPLEDAEFNLLPSTSWRSVVLGATLMLEGSTPVDVYGGNLTYYSEDCLTHPYSGNYGNGAGCPEAFLEEQLLQADRIVSWIDERSTRLRRPTVVALDTDTGLAYGQTLTERNPEVFAVFDAAMGRAVAQGYEPACTFCGDNPLVTSGSTTTADSTWTQHLFLQNIPITSVVSTDRFLTEALYDQVDGDSSYKIPPSYYYGIRSVVRIQP
jgi:Domain of unknown function (DUF4397)